MITATPHLTALVDRVMASLRAEINRARDADDLPAFRFWSGLSEVVERMAADLTEDPRDAPEVLRYLQRSLAARDAASEPAATAAGSRLPKQRFSSPPA